jgi:hypothetical protein
MKHTKKFFWLALAVLVTIPVSITAPTTAQAQQLVFATPGYSEQFPFYVDGIFNAQELQPLYLFTILALGSGEEAPAGTLTLTLTPTAKSSDFLFKLDFLMIGASYALNTTTPQPPKTIVSSKASPLKIVQKIAINSSFGFVTVGVIVSGVENPGDFVFPAPFTMLVELSAGEKPAATN